MEISHPIPPRRSPDQKNEFRTTRRFPWTKEEDALLGKLTDREVAEKLNRKLGCVRDRRMALGKPAVGRAPQAFHTEREPADHYAQLFAAKSDRELRAILGWSNKRIETRRRQLAGGKVRVLKAEWTLEEDRLLGTKPDHVLARELGRSVAAVRSRRGQKRIRVLKAWRPEDDKVLGTRTDQQIAMLLGRKTTTVGLRRRRLGIAPKAKPRPWTPEEEAMLGTKTDAQLARMFDRTVGAVEARRIELGLSKPDSAFKIVRVPGAHFCTWTPEQDALVGTASDEEVARKLGYSTERVRRRRHLLGLPSNNPSHRHWTQEEIALLGTRPDREVGEMINRTLGNVRAKRLELGIPFSNPHYEVWKPDEIALLGTMPDKEVARRTGHSLKSILFARHKRGILSVRPSRPWTPEEEALLGTAPDKEIAARLDRTPAAVRLRRVTKGIRVSTDSEIRS